MNANFANSDEILQLSKSIDLRHKGIFFVLGGLVFLLQGLFYLNDTITELIFLILEFIYVFVFPEKAPKEKQQFSPIQKFFRWLLRFALLLIMLVAAALVGVWLWRITGIPFSFLAAISCALVGSILIGWSYITSLW